VIALPPPDLARQELAQEAKRIIVAAALSGTALPRRLSSGQHLPAAANSSSP
jgi:hypothetical protein